MKIKIVKCSDPDWWYSQRIGQIAEVIDSPHLPYWFYRTEYFVSIDGLSGCVRKTDCEIVEERV
jgi:hypothetical protein